MNKDVRTKWLSKNRFQILYDSDKFDLEEDRMDRRYAEILVVRRK